MLYPWPRVRKCWLSMIIHFKQCCVIDSLLTNNFHSVKEVNVRDNRKCCEDIKNNLLFSWEGLLEIRSKRRKDWELHLTENILQDIIPPSSEYLFVQPSPSVKQKKKVEILTARYRSYFQKKFKGAYASQTGVLYL